MEESREEPVEESREEPMEESREECVEEESREKPIEESREEPVDEQPEAAFSEEETEGQGEEAAPSGSSDPIARAGHTHGGGGGGVKTNVTPPLLFSAIEAPGFKLEVNYGDWRFAVKCKNQTPSNCPAPPYHNKHFSRSFARCKDEWKSVLKAVHEYMWKKHYLMTNSEGAVPEIPEYVMTGIGNLVQNLPPPKMYGGK